MPNATHEQEARAFADRLRKALARAGVRASPTLVANEFNQRYWGRGITPHTARNWLLGVSIPMQDKLRALAEWLEVEPDELRFGPSGRVRSARENGVLEARLRHGDREMLERYLSLPVDGQKIVREVVLAMSVSLGAGKPRPGRPPAR